MNLYEHEFEAIDGGRLAGRDFAGRPVLVVNTASECGFTPQYADLQQLWERYRERGLVVLGLPSNDFGGQEPGDEATVHDFCQRNYGVDFPLTAKVGVLDQATVHPLYQDIHAELGDAGMPRWNFHKFLFDADGELVGMWGSKTKPLDDEVIEAVEAELPA